MCKKDRGDIEAGKRFTELGFEHVTLDLHGYETGSVSPDTADVDTSFDSESPTSDD